MVAVAFVVASLLSVAAGTRAYPATKDFAWSDIEPSKSLEFHGCFGNHECARLDVPMDWNSTYENGSRVAVAIIKIPARVPVTDKRYGGAILLNPGGPGGSGVSLVFRYGEHIQRVADAATDPTKLDGKVGDKYFDILSFDPRGVNNTTPQVICFPDFESRQGWERSIAAEGTISSSDVAFSNKWARYLAITGSCTERMNATSKNGENLLEHVNTAPVVGDMVAIIEALGEWREKKALTLLNSSPDADMSSLSPARYISGHNQDILKSSDVVANRDEIIERIKWKKGEEKLLYWGFSYGSVLGATFAAMQPQRVGRVIIDGVVDGEDYYSAEFKMNLNDADYVFSQFFHFCAVAGPKACDFAEKENETAEQLRKKFDALLADLLVQPIPVFTDPTRINSVPDIVTSSDLLRYLRESLYSPLKAWPVVAKVLHEIQNRNGTALSIIKNQDFVEKDISCSECDDPYSSKCQGPTLGEDPEMSASVWCADGVAAHVTPEVFKNTTLKGLREQSLLFGDIWAELRMQCVGWNVRPKWGYNGIFKDIKTSHPVFVVGTTGDHVCPMVNAHKMAKSFVGAVALEQKSQGHCSLSGPSLCTSSYVRLYFQTGELPHVGTRCGVDQLPFEPSKDMTSMELNQEEKDLWEAIRHFDGLY